MNINELKVGDKISYYTPYWMLKYNHSSKSNGYINFIGNKDITVDGIIIDKSYIISKLESVDKEIPIQHKKYFCPKCGKVLQHTNDKDILYSKICESCAAPKSIKYDVKISSYKIDYNSHRIVRVQCDGCNIDNNSYFGFTGLEFPDNFDINKIYTITIEEKK